MTIRVWYIDDSDVQEDDWVMFEDGRVLPRQLFAPCRDADGNLTHWVYQHASGDKYIIQNQ